MSAKSTFQKVQGFSKTEALLDQVAGVVIALSGGPDSMALLDIFVRLQKASSKKSLQNFKLHLAHLNHQLRGKASEEDAEFVSQLSEHLAIPATIAAIDIHKLAKETGKGIEETARLARYKFLLDTAIKTGCDRIATGHTMNDQAETFLLRLVRGAGLRGLAAMRPRIPAHQFDRQSRSGRENSEVRCQLPAINPLEVAPQAQMIADSPQVEPTPDGRLSAADVLLIRPLLCLTREEVEAYCAQRRLRFHHDASNECLEYNRNRLRHGALKYLREVNPRIVEHLAQTARIVAADQDTLEELTNRVLEKARLQAPDERRATYRVEEINKQPTGLRRRVIIEAMRQAQVSWFAAEPRHTEIEMVHVTAVDHLLEAGASGLWVMLPNGLEVWRDFDTLVFTPALKSEKSDSLKRACPVDGAMKLPVQEYLIDQKERIIEYGEFKIHIERQQNKSRLKSVVEQAQEEKRRTGRDWLLVALDDAVLPERISLRSRRTGEQALVVGQRKIKKLKNLMIDHKIASSRRATWLILATSDGEYVWSPGLPPAIKFAANDKTTGLAILYASNI